MTKNQYRLLVVASAVLLVLSTRVDVTFDLLPNDYRSTLRRPVEGITIMAMCSLLLGWLAGIYGCMRFCSWAPPFNLALTVCGLIFLISYDQASVLSSWAQVLDFLANGTFGLVLMLPYLSPEVSEMFWPGGTP